jgi:phosphoenolpyruvate carboxykinase (GTP)
MGDYFGHWLQLGREIARPPLVFHANWFRADDRGRFLWPGFGQNLRVLLWIAARVHGRGAAVETPIGLVPTESALDWDGLDLSPADRKRLLAVDRHDWIAEVPEVRVFFERFGDRLPAELSGALSTLEAELPRVAV